MLSDSDQYLKPKITEHPKSQVALKDGTLNLTCQSVASASTPLSVLWKKDHVVYELALVAIVGVFSSE